MSDVLEGLGMLQMMRHHAMLWWGVRVARYSILIVFIVVIVGVLLAHEVLGPLVLVCSAILRDLSAHVHLAQLYCPGGGCIRIGSALLSR